jgi:hypothetical protein
VADRRRHAEDGVVAVDSAIAADSAQVHPECIPSQGRDKEGSAVTCKEFCRMRDQSTALSSTCGNPAARQHTPLDEERPISRSHRMSDSVCAYHASISLCTSVWVSVCVYLCVCVCVCVKVASNTVLRVHRTVLVL